MSLPTNLTNPHAVELFIANLVDGGLQHSFVVIYLAGIKRHHLSRGHPDPTSSPRLRLLLDGVKKSRRSISDNRLPITFNLLRATRAGLDRALLLPMDRAMLW